MFCWLHKFKISNTVDSKDTLSPRTQRHLRGCPDCRAFYETSLSFGEGLRRQAADSHEALPENFAQRVFDAASAGGQRTLRLPVRWLRPVLVAACIAIIALLAVVFLTSDRDASPSDRSEQFANVSRWMDDGSPKAWAGLVEKPLSKEIDNLAEGTESAVRFLVACVAVNPARTAYQQPN